MPKSKTKQHKPPVKSIAADALRAIAKQAGRRTFSDVFRLRLVEIEARMTRIGSNWSEVCRLAKVSRAQPNRYADNPPKTIKLIDQLESALDELERDHKQ